MMTSLYVSIFLFKVGLELKVFSFLFFSFEPFLTYCFVEDFNCTDYQAYGLKAILGFEIFEVGKVKVFLFP